MKTFKLFSIAALALAMAACSNEDIAQNSDATQEGQKMPFTATIGALDSNAATRTTYTESGTDINVAWKVGDKLALIHNGKKEYATVEKVDNNGSATISGVITAAKDEEIVRVCYPADSWEWDSQLQNVTKSSKYLSRVLAQDGTLQYIQDSLDVRMDAGELKVEGEYATLNKPVNLASRIVIWKFTLQDDATPNAVLAATKLAVTVPSLGDETITLASTKTLTTATSSVYLAMEKVAEDNVTLEATVGNDTYTYTKENVNTEHGQYYQSTVTMTKKVDNTYLKWDANQKQLVETALTGSYTMVQNADQNVTWQAGTYVVEGNVTINGGIILNGDVELIIKDGAKLTANPITGGSSKYNLSIYGQANQTGQLVVDCSINDAIYNITTLEVHSCKVKSTSSAEKCGGIYDIQTFNVYGGSVDAECTGSDGYGIYQSDGGSMNIYGGEVKAVGKGTSVNSYGIMASPYTSAITTVTVYGGKLYAESVANQAINSFSIILTRGLGFAGKIETSDDGNNWAEWTRARTPDAKYVRAGY